MCVCTRSDGTKKCVLQLSYDRSLWCPRATYLRVLPITCKTRTYHLTYPLQYIDQPARGCKGNPTSIKDGVFLYQFWRNRCTITIVLLLDDPPWKPTTHRS